MNLNLYDKDLNRISIIGNNYKSCLWAEGYNSMQPFTVELPLINEYKQKLKKDFYIGREDRQTLMVIRSIEYKRDTIEVKGYQATQILDDSAFVGTIDEGTNIDSSIPLAYNESTKVYNLEFAESQTGSIYKSQISNKSMLELCEIMCQATDSGVRVVRSGKQIKAQLYKPVEKENLVFSEFFGNLKVEAIKISTENEKNFAIVLGDGEGEARTRVDVDLTDGAARKEIIVDARDIQQEEGESLADYQSRLRARGIEKLLEHSNVFQVSVIPSSADFGKKYDLGDILTIRLTDYGITTTARVVRFVEKSQKNVSTVTVDIGNILKIKRRK